MVPVIKTIEIEPDSETAKHIMDATNTPAVLVINGSRFRVEREPNPRESPDTYLWSGYDPQRAIDGMRAAAGSWRDVDTEQLKADIRRWREEGSREPVDQ